MLEGYDFVGELSGRAIEVFLDADLLCRGGFLFAGTTAVGDDTATAADVDGRADANGVREDEGYVPPAQGSASSTSDGR